MGATVGVVVVFEGDGVDGAQVLAELADVLRDPSGRTLTAHSPNVWDLGHLLPDGVISIKSHELGFTLLTVRLSVNGLLPGRPDTETNLDRVEAILSACGQRLPAVFGYFTRYPNQLDDPWLTNQVLIPLLAEAWGELRSPSYHLRLLGPAFPPADPSVDGGVLRAHGPWGAIVLQGHSRNPLED